MVFSWSNLVKTLVDLKGRVPGQYFNPATGEMEVQQGSGGAANVSITGSSMTGAAALIAPGAMVPVLQLEGNPTLANQIGAGPGNPYVFYNPQAATTQMLFRDQPPGGSSRGTGGSLYLCNIDQNLNTSNFQQIVASTVFGTSYTGFGAARCYWDTTNQEWIFTCSLYQTTSGANTVGYFTMNADFSAIVNTLVVIASNTVNSTAEPWDSGMELVPGYDKTGLLAWVTTRGYTDDSSGMAAFQIVTATVANIAARPWTIAILPSTYWITLPYWNSTYPDVINVQMYKGGTLWMVESQANSAPFNINFGFTPQSVYSSGSSATPDIAAQMQPIWADSKLVPNTSDGITNAGHPFFSNCLGFPALFFVNFRDTYGSAYGPGEIWCMRLEDDWLEKNLFPATALCCHGTYGGAWFPTFGHPVTFAAGNETTAAVNLVIGPTSDPASLGPVIGPATITQSIPAGSGIQYEVTGNMPWLFVEYSSNTGMTQKSRIYMHVAPV